MGARQCVRLEELWKMSQTPRGDGSQEPGHRMRHRWSESESGTRMDQDGPLPSRVNFSICMNPTRFPKEKEERPPVLLDGSFLCTAFFPVQIPATPWCPSVRLADSLRGWTDGAAEATVTASAGMNWTRPSWPSPRRARDATRSGQRT